MQEGTQDPVQYAKRVVGRRVYGGQSTHIRCASKHGRRHPRDLRVVADPVPGTLTRFVCHVRGCRRSPTRCRRERLTYTLLYMGLIVFFTYFYTAIVFNPNRPGDNMKK